jgi:SAM-dependent methyltransferase
VRESAGPDFAAITERQQQVWSSGDFNVIAIATMWAAEMLVEAVDPHAGDRVLDVACGSGNLALVAAPRYCEVTGIEYVPSTCRRSRPGPEASRASGAARLHERPPHRHRAARDEPGGHPDPPERVVALQHDPA